MENEQRAPRTELKALGEFGLIEHLTEKFPLPGPGVLRGVGDDAAVIEPREGERLLVATDILLEGIHFDLTYFPLMHLGYKAVIVNLSDIYAMNGRPAQITLSLGVSSRFTVEMLDELYLGVRHACEEYGVDLVGGDTSASLTGLTISVTVLGYAPEERICYRSGAQPNELLCVTGNLGAAYVGLQLLEREKRVLQANPEATPNIGDHRYVLQRMLRPEARRDAVEQFRAAGFKPSAMIDVSDGLSSEILHICRASKVGCRIYPERIPIDQQVLEITQEMRVDPLVAALNGGEDFELLFTAPLSMQDIVDNLGVSTIGYTTTPEQGTLLVSSSGQEIPIVAQGWNAFEEE